MQLHPPLGTASLALPCGGCIGCRQMRATEWARRCSHEAKLYDKNVFATLTYDDDHLPSDGGLAPRDFQLFMKRLRKRYSGSVIRFFACGEYGETTYRPHYHALLFNLDFSDKYRVGKDLFASDSLRELWPFGDHKIGEVTPASAAYVAKYNVKYGARHEWCNQDGVVLQKPFLRMSRRPGIGKAWLDAYAEDLRNGFLVSDGRPGKVPRSYVRRLEGDNPALADAVSYAAYARRLQLHKDGVVPEDPVAAERIVISRVAARNL